MLILLNNTEISDDKCYQLIIKHGGWVYPHQRFTAFGTKKQIKRLEVKFGSRIIKR